MFRIKILKPILLFFIFFFLIGQFCKSIINPEFKAYSELLPEYEPVVNYKEYGINSVDRYSAQLNIESHSIYPDICESVPFIELILNSELNTPSGRIHVYEYLKRIHNSSYWNRLIGDLIVSKDFAIRFPNENVLSKSDLLIIKDYKNMVSVNLDSKTDYMEIAVRMQSAELASQMVVLIKKTLIDWLHRSFQIKASKRRNDLLRMRSEMLDKCDSLLLLKAKWATENTSITSEVEKITYINISEYYFQTLDRANKLSIALNELDRQVQVTLPVFEELTPAYIPVKSIWPVSRLILSYSFYLAILSTILVVNANDLMPRVKIKYKL